MSNWYTMFLSGKLGSVLLVHDISFRKAVLCLTGTLFFFPKSWVVSNWYTIFFQEGWVVSNWYTIFLSGKLGSV